MNITILIDVFGEENNGTIITTKRLVESLEERGHNVRIVSYFKNEDEHHIALPKRSFGTLLDHYIQKNGVIFAKPDDKILHRAIEDSDIVHIMTPFKCGVAGLKICNALNIPVTSAFHCQPENVTSHVFMKDFKPLNNLLYKRYLRTFYKDVGFVHCPSKMIADNLRKNGYKMDLRIISNGVAPIFKVEKVERPKQYENKFLIAFVGRFSKEKRHDLLIKAVKNSKYADKIQLLFFGNGPQEEHIRKLCNILPLYPIFDFCPKEELAKILNYCDLYIHPSDAEIEAIACLEAISCGLVPIISDSKQSATNAFALESQNLFNHKSYKDLSKKIDYFIENPQEVQRLQKKYNDYATEFSLDKSIDKMEKMFFDAIASKKH